MADGRWHCESPDDESADRKTAARILLDVFDTATAPSRVADCPLVACGALRRLPPHSPTQKRNSVRLRCPRGAGKGSVQQSLETSAGLYRVLCTGPTAHAPSDRLRRAGFGLVYPAASIGSWGDASTHAGGVVVLERSMRSYLTASLAQIAATHFGCADAEPRFACIELGCSLRHNVAECVAGGRAGGKRTVELGIGIHVSAPSCPRSPARCIAALPVWLLLTPVWAAGHDAGVAPCRPQAGR